MCILYYILLQDIVNIIHSCKIWLSVIYYCKILWLCLTIIIIHYRKILCVKLTRDVNYMKSVTLLSHTTAVYIVLYSWSIHTVLYSWSVHTVLYSWSIHTVLYSWPVLYTRAFFPSGSAGISSRKSSKSTGNNYQNLNNWANTMLFWGF